MTRHIPHLYLEPPWSDGSLRLPVAALRHLRQVLRLDDGAPLSYTDGAGTVGRGTLEGGSVARGVESTVARPRPSVAVAVAPLRKTDRNRFLVEKLAELGVDELIWLQTRYGSRTPPRADKATAWAIAGLEQSRGAWRMAVNPKLTSVDELAGRLIVAEADGGRVEMSEDDPTVLLVGPEGGFADGELPPLPRLALSDRVLRTETAAIVGAGLLCRTRGDKSRSVL